MWQEEETKTVKTGRHVLICLCDDHPWLSTGPRMRRPGETYVKIATRAEEYTLLKGRMDEALVAWLDANIPGWEGGQGTGWIDPPGYGRRKGGVVVIALPTEDDVRRLAEWITAETKTRSTRP